MVSTRRSRKPSTPKASTTPTKDSEQTSESSGEEDVHDDENQDEENNVGASEPKPISSDSSAAAASESSDDESFAVAKTKPSSRLFAPYRSLGVVTSGRPYFLSNHGSSSKTAFCTLPIGNQFHILQCDRLQPVMVSRPCSSGVIDHVVSDASLGITLAAHSNAKATLYARTKPLVTVSVAASRQWNVVDMLHLGKTKLEMDGEKEGKSENAAIVAFILAKGNANDNQDPTVPVVGDDDDDSSEDDNSDDDDDDESMNANDDESSDCVGQVVVMLATRTSLVLQKRISLPPHFSPCVALHPSTYLNKIILGSSSSPHNKQHQPLILLNIKTGKLIHTFLSLPTTSATKPYYVTALEQSPAVDTVAVGTSHGMVHLVNLRHDVKLFTLRHKSKEHKKSAPRITSLSFRTDGSAMRYGIAPLAVGRSDGTISVWDLTPPSEDEDGNTGGVGRKLLCDMPQVHAGGVAKLTYLPQEPLLLSTGTASNSIQMHIFDSPDHSGRVLRQRSGHTSPPTCIKYKFPANGLLLHSAMDGTDAATCQILSGGGTDRSLRVFSSARSVLDKEFSQGKGLDKKAKQLGLSSKEELLLPPVVAMATSQARKRDWGDLVTIHRNSAFAYVWNTQKGSQSGPVLRQNHWNVSAMAQTKPPATVHATCVTMSACGNFCLVGTKGGAIYKYNVQSGIPRGSYPRGEQEEDDEVAARKKMVGNVSRTMSKLEKQAAVSNRTSDMDKVERDAAREVQMQERLKKKLLVASHTGAAVRGMAVDSLNKTLVSVGSDGKLILWSFLNHVPHKKSPHQLPSPATKLCHVSDSDLAAIAMEDYSVVLFDCSALSIVRRFGASKDAAASAAHTGPITDLGFSPDGRSLFTSSLDGTIRVWDVPTNTCVDWLKFRTPPTALSLSPTGEFLATTHKGHLGISLWSDKSFYQTVHVDGANPPTQPAQIAEDGYDSDEDHKETALDAVSNTAKSNKTDESLESNKASTVVPLAKEEGLITLSGLPPAHWKNLFHLELVKERNKPREAPKKPPTAPFFLQWRSGEAVGSEPPKENTENQEVTATEEDEWDAAWSDDEDKETNKGIEADDKKKKRASDTVSQEEDKPIVPSSQALIVAQPKRRKVVHHRSHLAGLLKDCEHGSNFPRFQAVTEHVASLGPSGIDVALSTLCNGMHDLEEGLPLLHLTALWLLEACESRERYEAVNAYLHRFLYLHSNVIAGIDDTVKKDLASPSSTEISEKERQEIQQQQQQRRDLLEAISKLRIAQHAASGALRAKMQNSLCLLRHFSRMV